VRTVLITGGAGFIGSNFVNVLLRQTDWIVIVFDKLTYAGSLLNLQRAMENARFKFVAGDIADRDAVDKAIKAVQPDAIAHLAAETHVDRSIDGPRNFIETNVLGTFELVDSAYRYWRQIERPRRENFRFIQISTDEVYGALEKEGRFKETHAYAPNSPYAASKASADHFVRAYRETFGLPTIITNCSNNYGFYQYPEKLIPLTIVNGLTGRPIPIYGTGQNVRDWLFVEDHCTALLTILERGRIGEKYNIGGNCERTNLQVVDTVCSALELFVPARDNPALVNRGISSYSELKTLVKDRPGHDLRYAIDSSKLSSELGWLPKTRFEEGIRRTVNWYLSNRYWWARVDGRLAAVEAESQFPESHTFHYEWQDFRSNSKTTMNNGH
jgi:dTDP-glucose 4,6-dehydratase